LTTNTATTLDGDVAAYSAALRHHAAGRLDEAEPLYRQVLAADPAHAGALHHLGVILRHNGQPDLAVEMIGEALRLDPTMADAHHNLGNALRELDRLDEAVDCYRRAIALRPDFADAHNNLAYAHWLTGRVEEAIAGLRTVAALRPDSPDAHKHLGDLLRHQEDRAAASDCYRRVVTLRPDDAATWFDLGIELHMQRRLDEAVACYERVIALSPDHADAHCHLAFALLALGDLPAAWPELEWRWRKVGSQPQLDIAPLWQGKAADGRTLLIEAEQGFGDVLQFCRYATLAASRGFRVIVQAPSPLLRLLRTLPGVDQVVSDESDAPPIDLHCPMLSLPLAFGTTLATIPASIPYLLADPAQAGTWRRRIAAMPGEGLRVGVAWAGNPRPDDPIASLTDRCRSIAPERLAPLFDLQGVRFFSLQKGGPAAPASFPLIDVMGEMDDFADTAALIANLDLVITVDTAVVHLAGALGKPVWMLDRVDACWRWLVGRTDSPWYPALRIYRQPRPGDWDAVVAEVARDLRRAAESSAPDRFATSPTPHEVPAALDATARRRHAMGHLDEAESFYRQVLTAAPEHAGALHHLGIIAGQRGRFDLAAEMIVRALRRSPNDAEMHHNLGVALAELGRLTEAVTCYRRAIALRPDYADAHKHLGAALRGLRRYDDAIACCRTVVALKPDDAWAHTDLGYALSLSARLDEAAAALRTALELRPDFPEALNNLGNVMLESGEGDAAVAAYRQALALRPDYVEAHNNLGVAFWRTRRAPGEEAACYRRAISLKPDGAEAHYNLGQALLAQGDMPAGWQEFEWRWLTQDLRPAVRNFAQPQWLGEAAEGRTLLIHAEQGFGDTLQFCRYAPLAAARGLRVILGVPQPLVRLLGTLAGVDQVCADTAGLPEFDLHSPMLSLPLAFRTTLATIPADVPYLHADPAQAAAWAARIAAAAQPCHNGPGLRVGIVWAGNARLHQPTASLIDRRRSIDPQLLAPLADIPGIRFFSLQKDGPAAPAGFPLIDLMGEMGDFADTAALIANLDLVVSVDTAVAHLAGALGKPVWLLDRYDACWRWLVGRTDSPWYPALRIYRQPRPGDWETVVAEVARDLRHAAAGTAARPPATPPTPREAPESLFAAALRHHAAGRLDDAERSYRELLAIDPRHAGALHRLGVIAGQKGRPDLAAGLIGDAIRLRPDDPEAHHNRAVALRAIGRLDDAVAAWRTAVALRPDYADAHQDLGYALYLLGRLDEATESLRTAVALRPDSADAHNDLGNLLSKQGDWDAAIACYRRAVALRPDFADAYNNLGHPLWEMGERDEAVACHRRAIALRPDYPEAHTNLGVALRAQWRLDEAVASHRRAIALRPDYAEAHTDLALALLARGDLPAGWAEFEWRWRTEKLRAGRRAFAQPQWRGDAAEGRTLLIHAEQGFGDTLQFCRYAPLAAARGLRVILQVPRPLVRLLGTLAGVDRVLAEEDELPAFALQCPVMSLPLAFGTTLDTIPAAIPYLHADPAQAAAWAARVPSMAGQTLRVGLVWAGNPRVHQRDALWADRRRSMAPERLQPLCGVSGVRLFSLQKDGPAAPESFPLIDVMGEMTDFADTAALIANLDLVISVDTAVAHLAGSLGKPVWLLARDAACWRWLDRRADSPWYPAMRIYRQPRPGDWDAVVAEVAGDLFRLAAAA